MCQPAYTTHTTVNQPETHSQQRSAIPGLGAGSSRLGSRTPHAAPLPTTDTPGCQTSRYLEHHLTQLVQPFLHQSSWTQALRRARRSALSSHKTREVYPICRHLRLQSQLCTPATVTLEGPFAVALDSVSSSCSCSSSLEQSATSCRRR